MKVKFFIVSFLVFICEFSYGASIETENSLIGIVKTSSFESIKPNDQITLTGLKTNQVTVVFPDGAEEVMKKIHENENLIIIQFISNVGSMDILYITKQNRGFTLVSIGALNCALEPTKCSVRSALTTSGVFK